MGEVFLPSLYKARRVPTKQTVCAICADRTRGRTRLVRLSYGVSVMLCEAHASVEFQRQRSGRDFVVTLQRLWEAHGCLTKARGRALDAHLRALARRPARARPGSYAWPRLRREAESLFAAGAHPQRVIARLRARHAANPAHPPSVRSMRRWHSERRWLTQPATGPP
jgi:hypothetical protein